MDPQALLAQRLAGSAAPDVGGAHLVAESAPESELVVGAHGSFPASQSQCRVAVAGLKDLLLLRLRRLRLLRLLISGPCVERTLFGADVDELSGF